MCEQAINEYFKGICKNYYLVLQELKRLKDIKEKNKHETIIVSLKAIDEMKDVSKLEAFWQAANNDMMIIISGILSTKEVIVTTKEEVVAIIMYHHKKRMYEFPKCIWTGEEELKSFPKDDFCQEFLKAYLADDNATIESLYQEYVAI